MQITPPFAAIAFMTLSGMLRTMGAIDFSGGVRGKHGSLAHFDGIQHCFVGDVRNIHHHADAVHFPD